jgi:hypothetical protein
MVNREGETGHAFLPSLTRPSGFIAKLAQNDRMVAVG